MDLLDLDTRAAADAGARMPLLHPANGTVIKDPEGNDQYLTLVGADSEIATRFQRRLQNELSAKQAQRRGGARMSAEEQEERSIAFLTACTIGWNVYMGGKKLEHNSENVKAFYEKFNSFREDADRFIGDRANFLTGSPKS